MLRCIALIRRVPDGIWESMYEYTKAPIDGRALHP